MLSHSRLPSIEFPTPSAETRHAGNRRCAARAANARNVLRAMGSARFAVFTLCVAATWTVSPVSNLLARPQPQAPNAQKNTIPAPWEKTDRIGDCKILWQQDGPVFAVKGDGRRDFEALWPIVNQNAPCLFQETADDFALDVTVPPHCGDGEGPFVKEGELRAAGLVVCSDEDRVVRLLRTGPKSIRAEWYYAGKMQGQQSTEVAEGPIHLRLEKREGMFNFFSSIDRSTWKRFWSAQDFTFGAQVKAGAVAINTSKQDFTARLPGLTFHSYGSPLGREIMPKWTSLFNGTDLTGWTVYPEIEKKNKKLKKKAENLQENENPSQDPLDDWRVEEGVLIGKGRRRALLSEQKFENFYFQAEMQINRAASGGIYFRPYPSSHFDGPDSTDFGMQIRGFGSTSFQTHGPGSWSNVSTGDGLRYREGQWITIGFIAYGPGMMMKQGAETLPASQDRRRKDFVGHIALQTWEPGTEIRFREIKIMELPKLPTDHRLTRPDAAWMTQLAYNIQFLIDEKKKIFEADKARFRQEKISFQKLIHTECDLIDTQIQWAIAKYQYEELADLFRKLIPLREQEHGLASQLVEAKLAPQKSADEIALLVTDAKARLAKIEAHQQETAKSKEKVKKSGP